MSHLDLPLTNIDQPWARIKFEGSVDTRYPSLERDFSSDFPLTVFWEAGWNILESIGDLSKHILRTYQQDDDELLRELAEKELIHICRLIRAQKSHGRRRGFIEIDHNLKEVNLRVQLRFKWSLVKPTKGMKKLILGIE